jgi:hypothetical protein
MGGGWWNKFDTMVLFTFLLDSFKVLVRPFGPYEENFYLLFGGKQTDCFSKDVCSFDIREAPYKSKPAMAAGTEFLRVCNGKGPRWRKRQMEEPIFRNSVKEKKVSDPGCVPHNPVGRSHTFLPAPLIILQTFAPDKRMLKTSRQNQCKLR